MRPHQLLLGRLEKLSNIQSIDRALECTVVSVMRHRVQPPLLTCRYVRKLESDWRIYIPVRRQFVGPRNVTTPFPGGRGLVTRLLYPRALRNGT